MSDINGSTTNGKDELPPSRKAQVEAGMVQWQELVAERDDLLMQVHRLKSDIAALKVANEAMATQVNDAHSRIETAMLVRDQAVAERACYETLFIAVNAQMRAFKIPAAPLIKERTEDAPFDDGGGHA